MTGPLSQAAATEHLNELRAAAGNRDDMSWERFSRRRRPALRIPHRPRRALAA